MAAVGNSGSFTNSGGAGAFTNEGTLVQTAGTLASLENTGTTSFSGTGSVTGLLDNRFLLDVTGTLDFGMVANTGTIEVSGTAADPFALSGGTFDNLAGGTASFLGTGSLLTTGLTNADGGTVKLNGVQTITGPLANMGDLFVAGDVTVEGGFSSTGTLFLQDASLTDQTATDTLTIVGDATFGETIWLDAKLGPDATGDSIDQIVVTGEVSGNAEVAFNQIGLENAAGRTLNFLTYGAGNGNLELSINPDLSGFVGTDPVLYQLNEVSTGSGSGTFALESFANPAIGGLASGLALTQSLMSSVVNRPSSAFVTPLADPGDDPCAIGSWARVTGGKASLTSETGNRGGSFENTTDASYGGLQVGMDRSCVGGLTAGWDLSYGISLGMNRGSTRQEVPNYNIATGQIDTSTTTSVTTTELRQTYASLYLIGAKDGWSGDLQYRFEKTLFDARNRGVGTFDGLGLGQEEYESTGHTLSGSLGYTIVLDEDNGWYMRPEGGFSLSKIRVSDITFENDPTDPTDDGLLKIDDIDNRLGFASVQIGKQNILPSGTAALTWFGVGTVYRDFSPKTVSTYFPLKSDQSTKLESNSDGLGTFGEVSLGVNYTKILNPGSALPARQLDIAGRIDSRFSEQLDSWGVTLQLRLQF